MTLRTPINRASTAILVSWGMVSLGACAGEDSAGGVASQRFAAQEVQRIGSVDGPDALDAVLAAVVEGDNILVLQSRPPHMVQYDVSGNRLGSFGRSGEGPGELRRPAPWLGINDETLWLADAGGREIEIFSSQGEFQRSLRADVQMTPGDAPVVPVAYLSSGQLVAAPNGISVGGALRGTQNRQVFLLLDESGKVQDTLYTAPILETDFVEAALPGGQMIMGGHPLQEGILYSVFPDGSGVVVVERWQAAGPDSAAFHLRVLDGSGVPQDPVSIRYVPVSAEGWRDRQAEFMRERMEGADQVQGDQFLNAVKGAWADRDYIPPVTRVLAAADGTVFLRREELEPDSVQWEVVVVSGEPIGSFALPRESRVVAGGRDEIWTLDRDDLGVEYLVRRQLSAPR